MTTPKIAIPTDQLASFCQRWKIIELSLFGSVLREDFGPDSDVDIMVEFESDAQWSLLDIVQVKQGFEELFGRKIDIVEKRALQKHHNAWLKYEILSTAERIWAA